LTTKEKSAQADVLDRFRRRVSSVGGLPTLPRVAAEVLRLAHDPDSSLKDMAVVISRDPPLTGRLLKVANSAFYGLSQQVGSLSVALVLLGMKNITNIVTSISIFRTLRFGDGTGNFTRQGFWEHSGACGKACDLFGKVTNLDLSGEGFVAGLIHDVGKIMLDAVFHNDFVRVLEKARSESISFAEAERRVLGTDHAQIGEWLAKTWHLPDTICRAIGVHHDAPCDPEKEPLGAAIQVSDAIVRMEGLGFAGFEPPPTREELATWPALAGRDFHWEEFADTVRDEFGGVQEFLSVASD
jgi:HD-like signal output (HDOD) protein